MIRASAWAALWHSENNLDGVREHLIRGKDFLPVLFKTRKQAREYIRKTYGYIASRFDLQSEPHGWRMPRPVRVMIRIAKE